MCPLDGSSPLAKCCARFLELTVLELGLLELGLPEPTSLLDQDPVLFKHCPELCLPKAMSALDHAPLCPLLPEVWLPNATSPLDQDPVLLSVGDPPLFLVVNAVSTAGDRNLADGLTTFVSAAFAEAMR